MGLGDFLKKGAQRLGKAVGHEAQRLGHTVKSTVKEATEDVVDTVNTLLYVAGLLGWRGFRRFGTPYTQRIHIGWGQRRVLFIWPPPHLCGKIHTKVRSSLCCP